MQYRLITFDITGTLLKTRKPVAEMYVQAGKSFGITNINSNSVHVNFKNEWNKMCKDHPNFGFHSGLGWERWWERIVKHTFLNSTNEKLCDETLDALSSYLVKLFATKSGWKLEEGTENLLDCIRSKGIKMGVISNFDIRLHNILKELGIENYFSFVLTSYETSYSKPDVNIFKLAKLKYEEQTGSKLENCALHVGDSIETDIKGAKCSGWNAVLISNNMNLQEYLRTNQILIFRNLMEFRDFIAK